MKEIRFSVKEERMLIMQGIGMLLFKQLFQQCFSFFSRSSPHTLCIHCKLKLTKLALNGIKIQQIGTIA